MGLLDSLPSVPRIEQNPWLVYKKQFFLISFAYFFCFYSFITSFHAVSVLGKPIRLWTERGRIRDLLRRIKDNWGLIADELIFPGLNGKNFPCFDNYVYSHSFDILSNGKYFPFWGRW